MDPSSRDVSLTIPAKPGYLVLARLALSAVCRLTSLEAVEVADLKLAVTEAANEFVDEAHEDSTVDFNFQLLDDKLVLELTGPRDNEPANDHELSRAIIEATVDDSTFEPGHTVLVKHL